MLGFGARRDCAVDGLRFARPAVTSDRCCESIPERDRAEPVRLGRIGRPTVACFESTRPDWLGARCNRHADAVAQSSPVTQPIAVAPRRGQLHDP